MPTAGDIEEKLPRGKMLSNWQNRDLCLHCHKPVFKKRMSNGQPVWLHSARSISRAMPNKHCHGGILVGVPFTLRNNQLPVATPWKTVAFIWDEESVGSGA